MGLTGAGLASTVVEAPLTYYVLSDPESLIPKDVSKYSLLETQWKTSPNRYMKTCTRYAIPSKHAEYEKDKVKGLARCNNSLCRLCGAYKAIDFAKKLEIAMKKDSEEYDFFMVTLTIDSSVSVSEQASIIQESYKEFIKDIRRKYRRAKSKITFDWSQDITVDLNSLKTHMHRHAIARIKKGTKKDHSEEIFKTWSESVVKCGARNPVRSAFYFEPVQTGERAAKYLFKAASEIAKSQGKANSYSSNRVGLWGLLNEIKNSARQALKHVYRRIISSMDGKRWLGVSNATNEAYRAVIESDDYVEEKEELKEDKRVITKIVAKGNSHRILCDSGALPELMWVLKNQEDGDYELEELRDIMRYLNQVEDNLLSVDLYEYFREEFRDWRKKVRLVWGSNRRSNSA